MLFREQMFRVLQDESWPGSLMPTTASAYLLFRLDEPPQEKPRRITDLTPQGSSSEGLAINSGVSESSFPVVIEIQRAKGPAIPQPGRAGRGNVRNKLAA
jgi:hypothetical protein